ncbi:WG repeat-containing protein [Clostridium cibarium]|uniref:WG repeat-containing protein n=1 Tax=Clostridium cibarium TaxID=2762247 RepID=A0ABR8PS60_9CLOT|nr:WG repeat-containing protein [Clostridium cibarium]MBD7910998.1 WG repeat-containing protein [Clostridium cibarium]
MNLGDESNGIMDASRVGLIRLYPALKNIISGKVYGYIDENGTFIIEPKYEEASDFNELGIAIVRENDLTGVIDSNGEYVIEPIYESISLFEEGRAVYVLDSNVGVMDERGNRITKKNYNYIGNFNEGRAVVSVTEKDESYYGYIDRDGNEVVPTKYLMADEFKGGVALVRVKNGEYALIDSAGKIINTYNYEYVSQYGDGLMVFSKSFGGPYGYLDKAGNVVIKPVYKSATGFEGGIAVVSTEEVYNFKYGAIDLSGKYVFTPVYSEIKYLKEGKVALGMPLGDEINIGSSIYAIGEVTGNTLTSFKYLAVGNYENGLAYASDSLFTFFIDDSGSIVKNLPRVEGSGELKIKDNIVLADIDYLPYYLSKNGEIIYKPNETIELSDKYSVTRIKDKPNINYLIYYPQVNEVSNKKVEKEINIKLKKMSYFKPIDGEGTTDNVDIEPDDVLKYNYYGDFSVNFFKKDLLVIDISGYYYFFYAAHGMPNKKTPSIDLVTGQFYSLGDLFEGGVDWIQEINKIIDNMIKTDKQYDYVFKDAFKGIKIDEGFYIDENNLYIYFPPYEIGPYAAGVVTFKIPFNEIENIINKEGNFYKAFNQ